MFMTTESSIQIEIVFNMEGDLDHVHGGASFELNGQGVSDSGGMWRHGPMWLIMELTYVVIRPMPTTGSSTLWRSPLSSFVSICPAPPGDYSLPLLSTTKRASDVLEKSPFLYTYSLTHTVSVDEMVTV